MATRLISPISATEFSRMMREAMPPSGWSNTLAVGNSGGPDSTCLLFLLFRYINEQHTTNSLPKRLVSLSIDHDLQASSSTMATRAANVAESLGIEHITAKLPWGQGNHPQKPRPGDKIEEKARDMRQMVLFEHMKKLDASALAFGHHADDQVETMLMRLGRGSSELGLAGMRPCRRWGMGSKTECSKPYAIEGMRRWIVRPLLGVGKDRIISTCEEHQLDYVTDPTNFQPQLTIRNAIRHIIQKGGLTRLSSESPLLSGLPHTITENLRDIQNAASQLADNSLGLDSSLQDLRTFNQNMAIARCNIDKTVDEVLAIHRIPSPAGTFMMSPLSINVIDSHATREALLFRIVRYVSPQPWGSPQAELGRRKTSISRLVTQLCEVDLFSRRSNNSLSVGSGVWWRLVALSEDKLSLEVRNADPRHLAWIAVRQPPQRSNNVIVANSTQDTLTRDITNQIIHQNESWITRKDSPVLEVLYDSRFLICVHTDKIPTKISKTLSAGNTKILVRSSKPWDIPQVFHRGEDFLTLLHSKVADDPFIRQLQMGSRTPSKDIQSAWITIQYYRPLSSV